MTPMVSICCAAYQQESTLEQTLSSFLAQKTQYPFEILVHDDASRDATPDIIRDFARRYPEIVKPILQTENQYSKGVPINETFNFPRVQGKYIALCEGDDYWQDESKLERQVAYMEAHPDCTFCFTNGIVHDLSGAAADREFIPFYQDEAAWYSAADRDYTLGEIAHLSFIPTATFLFPARLLREIPRELLTKECYHGDLRMKLFFTAAGYAHYVHALSCVYRANFPGSAMSQWSAEDGPKTAKRCLTVLDMLDDVDEFSQKRYTDDLDAVRRHYCQTALLAEPRGECLKRDDMRAAYHALPFKDKLIFTAKRTLPQGLQRILRELRR